MDYSQEPKAGEVEAPGDATGVQDEGLPAHTCLQAGRYHLQGNSSKKSDKTSLSLYQLSLLPHGVAEMGCSEKPEVALSWRTTKSLGSSSLQFLF